jgi:hypothetical protein
MHLVIIWQRLLAMGNSSVLSVGMGVLISGIFIWIGAHLTRVIHPSPFRAILAALACTAIVWITRILLGTALPLMGSIFGLFIGFLLALLVIKGIFDTSAIQAFGIWILFLLSQVVFAMLFGSSFFGNLSGFFWRRAPF